MEKISFKRALFALYVVLVFWILLSVQRDACEDFSRWTYLLGFIIFTAILFLSKWNPFKDVPLFRALLFTATFLFLAAIAWGFGTGIHRITSEMYAYLAYYVVYGGFFGIVEGVYMCPLVPQDLDKEEAIKDPDMGYDGAIEYLRYEYEKWWRGLNMLWVVIIAIVVSGVINWTIQVSAPPLNIAFFLAFSSVPGIAMIVWYMISKTNSIHEAIRNLYEAKEEERE